MLCITPQELLTHILCILIPLAFSQRGDHVSMSSVSQDTSNKSNKQIHTYFQQNAFLHLDNQETTIK